LKGTDLDSGCNTIEFRTANLTEHLPIVAALRGWEICPKNALPGNWDAYTLKAAQNPVL
jgi:hypothetical protein